MADFTLPRRERTGQRTRQPTFRRTTSTSSPSSSRRSSSGFAPRHRGAAAVPFVLVADLLETCAAADVGEEVPSAAAGGDGRERWGRWAIAC